MLTQVLEYRILKNAYRQVESMSKGTGSAHPANGLARYCPFAVNRHRKLTLPGELRLAHALGVTENDFS